jgi:DNA-binding transcriptional regulator WhiA
MSRSQTPGDRGRAAYSFTASVVAEVAPHVPPSPCCRSALIEGMRWLAGDDVECTRMVALRAALAVLHQGGVAAHVERLASARRHSYRLTFDTAGPGTASLAPPTERACCNRSRLRGSFLVAGRVSRPDAAPHLEFGCPSEEAAQRIAALLADLGVMAQVRHQRGWRTDVRSSSGIGDVLSCIGAQAARLAFEEGRVVHEVSADVNRRLNAETANLARTIDASLRQVAAIEGLQAEPGAWSSLSDSLRQAADLRLRWPQEPLSRLAEAAGCSRAAMAGRLGRLVLLAGRVGSVDC